MKLAVGAALAVSLVFGMDADIAAAQEPPRKKSIFDDPEETAPTPPPPKPKPKPETTEPEPPTPVAPTPVVPKVVRIERGPVPDAFALAGAQARLAEQLKCGEGREEKLVASKRLLESSQEAGEDRAARLVQLRRAAELAASAADLDLAFSAVDEQSRYFEMDAPSARRALIPLAAAGALAPEQHETVTLHVLQMTRLPLDASLHEEASRLVSLAEASAAKARKPALATRVRDRAGDLRLARSIFDQARPAMEKLKSSPDDPSANLLVGRYLCFVKHEWEEGVGHLAKGMDPNSKAVAQAEMVQAELAQSVPDVPPDPKAWLKIAEKWNEMGRSQQGLLRAALIGRSVHWYRKAHPLLDALDRALVDKRLANSKLLAPDLPELAELQRTAKVGGSGGGEFEDIMPDRAHLVGFRYTTRNFAGHTIIGSITPLFAPEQPGGNLRPGKQHGPGNRGGAMMAREGYVIGGLIARGGQRVDGFKAIFMRLRPDGSLDVRDQYDGPWIGGQGGGKETTLGCDGRPVVGLYGRTGADLDAIGLLLKN